MTVTASKILLIAYCPILTLIVCSLVSGCSERRSEGIRFELPDREGWYAVVFALDNVESQTSKKPEYVARFSGKSNVVVVDFPFEEGWAQDVFCIKRSDEECTPAHQLGYEIYSDRVAAFSLSGDNVRYRAFYLGKAEPPTDLPTEDVRRAVQRMAADRGD